MNREQRQLVAARVHHQEPPAIPAAHDGTGRGQVRRARPAPTRGVAAQRGERAILRTTERDDLVLGGVIGLNINSGRHGSPPDPWGPRPTSHSKRPSVTPCRRKFPGLTSSASNGIVAALANRCYTSGVNGNRNLISW